MCVNKSYYYTCWMCQQECAYYKPTTSLCRSVKKKGRPAGKCWRGIRDKWIRSSRRFCNKTCEERYRKNLDHIKARKDENARRELAAFMEARRKRKAAMSRLIRVFPSVARDRSPALFGHSSVYGLSR